MSARLDGPERAAILLMSLGEEEAAQVMKHMNAREVQKVGAAMATLSNITMEQAQSVMDDFMTELGDQTALGVGGDEYLRKTLINALGEDKANSLMDRIVVGGTTQGLDALKWMDARAVAEIIRLEHPQIIAIVLSHLDSDQAAEVLGQLSDRIRPDVIMRIASLDGIQPSAIKELDAIMEKQFSGNSNIKSSDVGGAKVAADMLNFLDSSDEESIMEIIREHDEVLGDRIQELMFVFDNLVDIDDRGIQQLLREVASDQLGIAMKGADQGVQDKIFRNMSRRAAEMLKEDIEAMGPVKISDVESAQKEILATARAMADAGRLSLGGKGEEYV
ncbi:flagellar motor switch protein FliG [Natronospira sp. AB-CW4]|uniref:Flagellar motor switch protein FliG n=2 Tax=Natronospira bacteriovora TaxID=3069753 RepID=A0ABU0W3Y4_9GAMM|nr:flagellar motor switch protein FliG [Natronospira sp. AB-CW4]MDQ2068473.1 flagellar motor switch protein FliG [Natronospira sp. AB-CW4]